MGGRVMWVIGARGEVGRNEQRNGGAGRGYFIGVGKAGEWKRGEERGTMDRTYKCFVEILLIRLLHSHKIMCILFV